MGKKIYQKIHNTGGMSILEMLSAVLILVLIGTGLASSARIAMNQYNKSMRMSEAKILCSTLVSVISNELAYTTNIHVDESGNVTEFLSQTYGLKNSLSTFLTDTDNGKDYGKILLGNPANKEEQMNLLGRSAYPNGLQAKVDSITYDNDLACFHVYLSIGYRGEEYLGENFQVLNVNRTIATVQ